jgi:hypothetical protein
VALGSSWTTRVVRSAGLEVSSASMAGPHLAGVGAFGPAGSVGTIVLMRIGAVALRISGTWRRLVTHFLYLVRHGEADPHDGPLSQAGERQAQLTGQRLKDVPFGGIHHGPLPRAAQTAGLIAASLAGVPVCACDVAGDYVPFAPDPGDLPPGFAGFLAAFSAAELADGRN